MPAAPPPQPSATRPRQTAAVSPAPLAQVGMHGQLVDRIGTRQWYHLGNGARSYDPVSQRFLRLDPYSPFGRGGINAYAFCSGDPVNRRDPSGYYVLGTTADISGYVANATGILASLAGIILNFMSGGTLALIIASVGLVLAVTGMSLQSAGSAMEPDSALGDALSLAGNILVAIGNTIGFATAAHGIKAMIAIHKVQLRQANLALLQHLRHSPSRTVSVLSARLNATRQWVSQHFHRIPVRHAPVRTLSAPASMQTSPVQGLSNAAFHAETTAGSLFELNVQGLRLTSALPRSISWHGSLSQLPGTLV